ncbi:MAG: cytochrome c-type biosis protein CcmF, partial [Actinomycetota bacterium]
MLAEGVNGLLGHSALIVGFASAAFGAAAMATATLKRDVRLVRTVQAYGWVVLVAAVAAVVVMERALITRDWSIAYIQKVGSPNTPALFNFTAL